MTLNEYLSALGVALSGSALSTLGDAITIVTGAAAPTVNVIDNPYPITRTTTVSGLMSAYTKGSPHVYLNEIHNSSEYQIRHLIFTVSDAANYITGITAQSAGSVTVPATGNATLSVSGGTITANNSAISYGIDANRMFHGDSVVINFPAVNVNISVSVSLTVVDASANTKHAYLRKTSATTTTDQIDLGAISSKSVNHTFSAAEISRLQNTGTAADWYLMIA